MTKYKQRLLALILAFTVPFNLTGCHGTDKQKATTGETDKKHKLYLKILQTIKRSQWKKILRTSQNLKRMAEISVYYELEDFYLSPEEVKEIREAANSMQSCNYTNTDYSDMAAKIIENSC